MKRIFKIAGIMAVSATFLLAGCSSGGTNTSTKDKTTSETQAKQVINGVSIDEPLKVDKEAGTVTVLAKVNGKYFDEPTRHAVVYETGKFGSKSVFTGLADQLDFYNGLVEIGAEAGNNMKKETAAQTKVEGDKIVPTFTWDGADKEYGIDEVINDSNGNPIDMRFGGNFDASKANQTGCIMCLDSCPVGIVSNSTYSFGAVEDRKEVEFTGNEKVLPKDGTLVAVTFAVEK